MTGIRLEIFSPGRASGPASRPAPVEQRIEAAREAAYAAGFLAGQAAATEAALAEEARLTSELVEAIADARVTNEAARHHVLASVGPMLEALVATVTPVLADRGLGLEIARVVERALTLAPAARPRLRCAPELVERLGALLSARGLEARIEPAPELLPREAQIFWDQGYDHLDLDACIAEIRACIASHVHRDSTSET